MSTNKEVQGPNAFPHDSWGVHVRHMYVISTQSELAWFSFRHRAFSCLTIRIEIVSIVYKGNKEM